MVADRLAADGASGGGRAGGGRSRRRLVAGLVVVLAVVAAVVVWTRPGPEPGLADAEGRLEVVLEDYRFDVEDWTVPAGTPVTLVLVNRDEVSHPLTFGGALVEADGVPVGYEDGLFDGLDAVVTPASASAAEGEGPGFTVAVPGGSTVTIEVTFPAERAGSWNVGCFLGRGCHLGAGLAATLTIG